MTWNPDFFDGRVDKKEASALEQVVAEKHVGDNCGMFVITSADSFSREYVRNIERCEIFDRNKEKCKIKICRANNLDDFVMTCASNEVATRIMMRICACVNKVHQEDHVAVKEQ